MGRFSNPANYLPFYDNQDAIQTLNFHVNDIIFHQ